MPSNAPTPTTEPARRAMWWAAALTLLAIHATLAVDTLRRKSVTVDEVGHLPAGISYWQKGTFEQYHHNPPLVKMLAALPALAAGPTVDYSKGWDDRPPGMPLNPWVFGWQFMYDNAARYHDIYFWARLPVVALSLVAGLVIFLWAGELFGPVAGLVGLTLWTFCPNAVAHAGMVTTDMGATSLGFVATYFFWRYRRQPTWPRAELAGVLLGLAQLAKFSSLLLYFIWPAVWLAWLVTNRRTGPSIKREIGQLLVMLLTSLFIINLGYFFEGTGTPLRQFAFLSRSLTRPRPSGAAMPVVPADHPWRDVLLARQNRFAGTWLANLPVPLPRHYVEGFDEQKLESEGIGGSGYPVYLCGELRRTGWWWYYFFALAVKVPVGTYVLMFLVIGGLIGRVLPRASPIDELILLAPVLMVVFVMSFLTDINLGLRYVLPIFPFWFVALSRVACYFETVLKQTTPPGLPRWLAGLCTTGDRDSSAVASSAKSVKPPGQARWRRSNSRVCGFVSAVALIALIWNAAECVGRHPDHLAYFNELVGGPKNASRYLIDSNLDWGQDLLALEEWLYEHRPGERVGLAYFGNVDPSILAASPGAPGIDFELAPPQRLDALRLLSTKPGGRIARARNEWIETHADELRQWLIDRQSAGRPVRPNDHPKLRQIVFDSIGLRRGPQPGLYAVSENLRRGLPFRIRDREGSIWDAAQGAYAYFGLFQPIGRAGQSILIYDISGQDIIHVQELLNNFGDGD